MKRIFRARQPRQEVYVRRPAPVARPLRPSVVRNEAYYVEERPRRVSGLRGAPVQYIEYPEEPVFEDDTEYIYEDSSICDDPTSASFIDDNNEAVEVVLVRRPGFRRDQRRGRDDQPGKSANAPDQAEPSKPEEQAPVLDKPSSGQDKEGEAEGNNPPPATTTAATTITITTPTTKPAAAATTTAAGGTSGNAAAIIETGAPPSVPGINIKGKEEPAPRPDSHYVPKPAAHGTTSTSTDPSQIPTKHTRSSTVDADGVHHKIRLGAEDAARMTAPPRREGSKRSSVTDTVTGYMAKIVGTASAPTMLPKPPPKPLGQKNNSSQEAESPVDASPSKCNPEQDASESEGSRSGEPKSSEMEMNRDPSIPYSQMYKTSLTQELYGKPLSAPGPPSPMDQIKSLICCCFKSEQQPESLKPNAKPKKKPPEPEPPPPPPENPPEPEEPEKEKQSKKTVIRVEIDAIEEDPGEGQDDGDDNLSLVSNESTEFSSEAAESMTMDDEEPGDSNADEDNREEEEKEEDNGDNMYMPSMY